jgi:hypothetical protein
VVNCFEQGCHHASSQILEHLQSSLGDFGQRSTTTQHTNTRALLLPSYGHSFAALMSSQVPDQALGDAVLQSVEHGTFPQSEHVASAPVPSSALPKLLEVVGQAREEAKVSPMGTSISAKG